MKIELKKFFDKKKLPIECRLHWFIVKVRHQLQLVNQKYKTGLKLGEVTKAEAFLY